MIDEVARSQAAALREWARQWQNDAVIGDGKAEVASRMFRAADMIDRVLSGTVEFEPMPKASTDEPVVAEAREG